MPMVQVTTTRATDDDQNTNPSADAASNAEPTQLVSASWPRSMKRPVRTAIRIGKSAKAAAITPSQTIDISSSTAR